jgi:hypothetical protein
MPWIRESTACADLGTPGARGLRRPEFGCAAALHGGLQRALELLWRARSQLPVVRAGGVAGLRTLVVMLHRGFGSADQAERSYGWNQLADREKFVVGYPDGVGRAWNVLGGRCGRPARQGIDGAGHQWPGSQPVREGPTRLRAHWMR